MKIHISNMSTPRSMLVVKTLLEQLGLEYESISSKTVVLKSPVFEKQLHAMDLAVKKEGLPMLFTKKDELLEKIKCLIQELVENKEAPTINFSELLSRKLEHPYAYLSQFFSTAMGTPIEQYVILQKIEKVKEMLVYRGLSVSYIASVMHYSSVGHLCRQFKQVMGLTNTHYKAEEMKRLLSD